MSIEYLKYIREQEAQADKIRLSGVTESKRIVDAAANAAADLIKNTQEEALALYKETLKKAEAEAFLDYDKTIAQVNWESDMLISAAQKHLDEAVGVIVNKVVS